MNDLLVKTAEFFFIPEAILSSAFLIVFVGIFVFGVYRQQKCREFLKTFDSEAEENFQAVATKMTPEMFIKKNLRKISVTEDVIGELPNVFVSIGIIATFLGLGVAIQGAAELLQTDKLELAKLTAVLGVIAFKFQTSVWGICFSIIFRSVILERYMEYRRQLVDEITDRLYVLERENTRTLIERQNELLSLQHKESLAASATQSQALLERLTAFETQMHQDNNAANENLSFLAKNFGAFVEVAKSFAQEERAFAESVRVFTERVKIFQEEFSTLVHEELSDLKAINENLGRIHAEHIQKIHDEQSSNIFYTTQELDKLHQKFYHDAKRFSQESHQALDELLDKTVGQVHDEYTREAREIRGAINEIKSTLLTIQENVTNVNQEFTTEQKQFAMSWQSATNKISATMDAFSISAAKESEKLETMLKTLESVASKLQRDYSDNLDQINALMQNASENFQATQAHWVELRENFSKLFTTFMSEQNSAHVAHLDELSAQSLALLKTVSSLQENQSQVLLNAVNSLQENTTQLTVINQATAEKSHDEIIALKTALENLTAVLNEERAAMQAKPAFVPSGKISDRRKEK